MKELITIIIPIYNVEKYLSRCIESIINQTYQQLQIILINDGSSDKSESICTYFLEKDSRIEIINKENGGLSSARNRGLVQARGEYIAFIDSDDYVEKDYIEMLYSGFSENSVDIIATGYKKVNERNESIQEVRLKYAYYTRSEAMEALCYEKKFPCLACAKIYRKKVFKKIKFNENRIFEDIDIMYKLINESKKIKTLPYLGYNYLCREGSIVNSSFDLKQLVLIDIMNEFYDFIVEKYPKLKKAVIRRRNFSYFWLLNQILEEKKINQYYLNYIKNNLKKDSKEVIFDFNSSLKDKIKCIMFMCFGEKVYFKIYKIYLRGKK